MLNVPFSGGNYQQANDRFWLRIQRIDATH